MSKELKELEAELVECSKNLKIFEDMQRGILAAIIKAKAKAEPTYLNQIAAIIGSEVKIQTHGACNNIKSGNMIIATFYLQQLQGCCGICVSYHASVNAAYRNKGIGSILNKMRQQIAWEHNYTVMLCTDVENNKPQQKILDGNGWQKLMTFTNRRTKNKVCIHAIQLKDTGMKVGGKVPEPQKV